MKTFPTKTLSITLNVLFFFIATYVAMFIAETVKYHPDKLRDIQYLFTWMRVIFVVAIAVAGMSYVFKPFGKPIRRLMPILLVSLASLLAHYYIYPIQQNAKASHEDK